MKPSEVIKERGWAKGKMINEKGEVCLAKAIMLSYKDDLNFYSVWKQISETHEITISGVGIIAWNDKPERTKEEVIQLLESIGQ